MDICLEEIMGINIEKMKNELKRFTDKDHYEHTLRACEIIVELAETFGADKEKAYLAALMHDYARDFCMDEERVLKYCEEHGVILDDFCKKFIPGLSHGPVGADMVMRRFGVTDVEVLDAISRHSAGDRITLLDKILALADALDTGTMISEEARVAAKSDLDKALVLCGRHGSPSEGEYAAMLMEKRKTQPKKERDGTSIYFVRHAQSDPDTGTDRTRTLTWDGHIDTRKVASFFSAMEIDIIYSSPYQRCLNTLRNVALLQGLEIIQDERLRESKYGKLNGIFHEVIHNRWNDFSWCEEDGETLGDLQKRNIAAVSEILEVNKNKNIVIGTHGTALSVILNYFNPSLGHDNYLRIAGFMPYIVKLDFNGNDYVGHEELLIVER